MSRHSQKGIARCPRCDRTITTDGGRYKDHSLTERGNHPCPMSGQHTPIAGSTPTDYVSRAYLITDLAEQVQDRDPAIVWEILTATPAAELQRILVIALAAVPINQPVTETWSWVCALPAAKARTTA